MATFCSAVYKWYSVVENLHDYSVGLMAPEGIGTAFINESSAKPGKIPLWGQKGEFVICVQGIRSLVKFGGIRWHGVFHFSFEAIELSLPFISTTGYRSQFVTSPNTLFGLNVQEATEIIFNEWLNEGSSTIEQTESLKERTAEINNKLYVKDMVTNIPSTGHCYQLSMF